MHHPCCVLLLYTTSFCRAKLCDNASEGSTHKRPSRSWQPACCLRAGDCQQGRRSQQWEALSPSSLCPQSLQAWCHSSTAAAKKNVGGWGGCPPVQWTSGIVTAGSSRQSSWFGHHCDESRARGAVLHTNWGCLVLQVGASLEEKDNSRSLWIYFYFF